jgi:hypothetical protein
METRPTRTLPIRRSPVTIPTPMQPVAELDVIDQKTVFWGGFQTSIKCDCGSCAFRRPEGWIVFDPVPLASRAWRLLLDVAPVHAIVLTSGNHQRESLTLGTLHRAPIHAPDDARGEVDATTWHKPGSILNGFEMIPLPGGGPGEAAWCDGHSLVLGDAVTHLDSLAILPDKYCSSQPDLRRSLRLLPELAFDRIFFAHGLPLITDAREAVTAFVENL